MSRYCLPSAPEPEKDWDRTLREFPLPDVTDVVLIVMAINVPVQLGIFWLAAALGQGGWIIAAIPELLTLFISWASIVGTYQGRMNKRNLAVDRENYRINLANEALERQRQRDADERWEQQCAEIDDKFAAKARREEIARLQAELTAARLKRMGGS